MNEKEYNELLIKSYIKDKKHLFHVDFRKLNQKLSKFQKLKNEAVFFTFICIFALIQKLKYGRDI